MCEHIKQRSYPVVERSGIVFAWLGAGEPSAFPHFDCFTAPDAYTFAFKGYWDCNWLQALEVGIDPAHASFLHRYFEDEDTAASYGKQFRGKPLGFGAADHRRCCANTTGRKSRVARTDYGMRLVTLRRIDDGQTHGRSTHILFPQAFVIPMNAEMTITQWHVPVDDRGCYWYSIFTSFTTPGGQEDHARAAPEDLPGARLQADPQPRQRLGLRRRAAAEGDLHRHGLRYQHPRPVRLRIARARSPTARRKTSAAATRASFFIGVCSLTPSRRILAGKRH